MAQPVQRLLLVEDSDDDVVIFRHALRRAGLTIPVLWLEGGRRAIDYLESTVDAPPSQTEVMFLDINMPRVSGFDVLTWLQKHPQVVHPPVIVMLTSSSEVKDQSKALALGANDYATKPPTPELFVRLAEKFDLAWSRNS